MSRSCTLSVLPVRQLTSCFALILALFGFAATSARAQQVVISQVYGAGGLTSATYNRDYVELHNRGASSVNITNWSIQYASATGSSWSARTLTGTIPAGGYFLVQVTLTGTTGANLPTPDFTVSSALDMSSTTGKVALVAGTAALPGQVSFQVGTNNIQDFVGYGQTTLTSTAGFGFEGGSSAPTLSATLAAFRGGAGCNQTHDNAADFTAALPAPRNGATSPLICTATGACCNGGVGTYTTSGACTGTYQGDFSTLGAGSYSASTGSVALDDISGTGTIVAGLDASDDGAVTFTLTPAMPFFGNRYTSLSVGANALLSFLPGSTATAFTNVAIPGAAAPNNIIAPIWMDMFVRPVATVPGAHVYTQQKTAPNRFIIQWNKVSTRASGTVAVANSDNLTFQAILYQDTGEIEFRYGAMNTNAFTPAYAATIGVEDMSGLVGTSVSGGSFAALQNTSRLFTSLLGNCSPPANDACATATVIASAGTGSGGTSGTNALATLDGGANGCGTPVSKDVWYAFQPATTGSWNVSTCSGTTQDTVLEIYDACGGSLVACADDNVGCGTGTQSFITTALASSQSYRIRLASKGAAAPGGTFTLVVVPTPPVNDECATALTAVNGVNAFSTIGATDTTVPAACSSITKDVWYAYTATATGTFTVTNCPASAAGASNVPSGWDSVIGIYSGTCGSLTSISCVDGGGACSANESLATAAMTLGQTYYIRIGSFNTVTTATGNFVIAPPTPPPANDVCSGAVVIAATPYTAPASAVNALSATDDLDVTCNSGTTTRNGVWFTYTPAANGTASLAETSTADTITAIFTGSCGTLTQVACSDPETSTFAMTAGTQYWILVGNWSTSAPTVNYGFTFDFAAPPANDACSGATPIAVPSVTNGSTANATAEAPVPPTCNGPTGSGSQSLTITNGVWYRVNVPSTQTVTLDTLATAYDSKIWVYTGTCGALSCVTFNDDIQGSPFQSKVAWVAQAGVDYYVLVAPFGTTTGAFTLTATGAATPSNDLCSTPTTIAGVAGSVAGTTVGATGDNNTSSSAMPSCNGAYSFFDVWYSYTAPCTGNLTLGTCGSYDTIVSVHTSCPTATVNNQVSGACNNDGPVGCTPGSQLAVAVTGGTTYLVRVVGNVGAAAGSAFTLTWSMPDGDGDGTADACDGCPLDPAKIAPGQCGCGVPDTDTDGDGTANCIDGCPNDPLKIAPGACGCGVADTDSDGDGTPNCNDGCPNDPNKVAPGVCGCGVSDDDTDGDGTLDCNDGCPNDPNKTAPGVCGCGVSDNDTDGDGTLDCNDGCPNDPLKVAPGVCGCGAVDVDTDGDGTADCNDGCPNDPNKVTPGQCGCGNPETDTDGDGTADCVDGCPNDPLKIAPGQCGCGVVDIDTDADGTADCNDGCPNDANKVAPGVCGCGVPDTDTDSDGTPDCNDGCPNDPLKTLPGVCGCGVPDTDTDSDGTSDCNDGCPNDPLKTVPGLCGCGVPDVQATYYQDLDGDGFGDASVTQLACTAPSGYVAVAGDCDDMNPAVNPGAAEVCFNGLDDDCNGTVDDLTGGPVHNVTQNAYFCTIQAAINGAAAGDVIQIAPGTYLEAITVDTSVTLLGANAGVDACSGARGPETIVMPPSGAATLAGTQLFVVVAAPDVVIDGFTFDGDNPALTSPFTANGANPDCDVGISAESPYANSGLVVRNNIVENVFQFGVALGATGQPAKAGTVTNNRIRNVPYWAGLLVYDDYYAALDDNCLEDCWRGVQTNNFYQPVPSGGVASISNNTITTQTQAIAGDATYTDVGGILVNLHYQGASTWTVAGNTVTNTSVASLDSNGIEVWSIQSAVGLTITGNDIDGFDYGYTLWNAPTTNFVSVTGGTVSNCRVGLNATNFDNYGDALSSSYVVSGVTFVATGVTTAGVAVVDSASNSNGATVGLDLANCDIQGGPVGIVVTSANGGDTSVAAHDNSITGQSGPAIDNQDLGSTVDATCNWYGSAAAQAIAPGISGLVTYSPWLVSGVDSNLGLDGFQPAAGTCLGTPVSIVLTSVTDTTCPSGSDGAVDVTTSGGSAPYSYLWSNGATTEDLVGVVAGNYSVTVTDAYGTTASTSATVNAGVDSTQPVITTCAPPQSASANGACAAVLPDFTLTTLSTDNCVVASTTQSPAAGTVVGLGTTGVTITVTDGSGNTATCSTSFTVADTTPPVVTQGSIASCYPTASAASAAAVAATSAVDNCSGILAPTSVGVAGTCNATITVSYLDGAGNPASAVYSTRIDNTPPTITCPADITTIATGPTPVTVPPPIVSDDCPGFTVTNSFNGTANASGTYPIGTTLVTFTVTDQCGQSAQCSMTVTVNLGAPQLRISQIFAGGGDVGSPYGRDYVELYNGGNVAQTMTNWALQLTTSTGTTWTVVTLNGTVDPGKHYLVGLSSGTAAVAPTIPAPDATGVFDLNSVATTGAKVALTNTVTALTGANPVSAAIVDFVGYGTGANAREPQATGVTADNAPGSTPNLAIQRLGCGGSDTNRNASDFAQTWPNPRNGVTAAANGLSGIATVFPYILKASQTARFEATVHACGSSAPVGGATVSVDLSSIALGTVSLVDNGLGGDEIAGDGLYCANVTLPAGIATGSFSFPVTYTSGGSSGGGYASLIVVGATTPANDNCVGAQVIAGPYGGAGVSVSSSLANANVECNPVLSSPVAPTSGQSNRRGVWYQVTGTGNSMTAALCATTPTFDSVVIVYGGSCDGMSQVAAGDDVCGTQASATWCSTLNTPYWVWVSHFTTGAQTNAFTLTITDSGTSCTGALVTTVCAPDLSPATVEPEAAFGPAVNDGCDSTPNLFTTVATPGFPASTLRGTSRGYGGNRDSDWYRFQAVASDTFTATLTGQFQGVVEIRLLSGTGTCSTNTLLAASAISNRCGSTTVSAPVVAGNWYAARVLQTGISLASSFGGVLPGGYTDNYVLSLQVGGPPPNDNCASATTLTAGTTYTPGQTNTFTTNDGTSPCDPTGRDVWYSLTLAATSDVAIDTCTSAIDTVVSVYSSCGGTLLGCNDDCGGSPCGPLSSCLTLPGLPAGNYRIRVSDKGIGSGGSFNIRAVVTLANDNCSGAQLVTCGSSTPGTTVGATLELAGVPTTCTGPGGGEGGQNLVVDSPGVWYRIVGTGDTVYADTLTANYDTSITVYTGSCGALSCVTVNDDAQGSPFHSKVAFQTVPGQDYYVLVHGFGSTSVGTFTLNVTCSPTPSNDLCSGPTSLIGTSGSLAATNVGATGDNSTLTSAALATCATNYSMFDTWYSWTALCSGNATFATCGTFDTVLSVHSACPSGSLSNQLTPTASSCNDNGPTGCTPGSSVTVAVTGGTTYLIRVATAGAATTLPGGGSPFVLTWALPLTDGDGDGTVDCLDGCPTDPLKVAPGVCGCGVSDVDSDGDGTADCIDGCPADPLKIAPGSCGCGVSELDTDGDGTPNCIDGCPNDPLKIAPGICGCDVFDTDTDGDGTADCNDGCPNDPFKVAPGTCGCGVSDADSDGDGTPNCIDGCPNDPLKIAPGQCGCGAADTDSDGDGTANCNDGCPNDPLKIAPGVCGCGVADTDSDGDGTPNCNDGCPNDPLKTAPGTCGCGVSDVDSDGDGLADCVDNCDFAANPTQADTDGDGAGNACDNCLLIPNPTQGDCDGDLIGDACEIASGSPDCNLNGIPDTCDITAATSFDLNSNSIPDECEQLGGTPFCFGETGCPCGNNSAVGAGQGCVNSTGQGARLLGSGLTDVSSDGLQLTATQLPPFGFAMFIQGTAVSGAPFVDGKRCAAGVVIRLGTKTISGGSASYPQLGDLPVSVRGLVPPAGGVRYYQTWYRNPAGPCGQGSNLSNGVSVVWTP